MPLGVPLVYPLDTTFKYFGYDVSLSSNGKILAVGAYQADPPRLDGGNAGEVYVYEYRDNDGDGVDDTWVRIGQILEGEDSGDYFGRNVEISRDGTILAVGAQYADGENNSKSNCGEVSVYQYRC